MDQNQWPADRFDGHRPVSGRLPATRDTGCPPAPSAGERSSQSGRHCLRTARHRDGSLLPKARSSTRPRRSPTPNASARTQPCPQQPAAIRPARDIRPPCSERRTSSGGAAQWPKQGGPSRSVSSGTATGRWLWSDRSGRSARDSNHDRCGHHPYGIGVRRAAPSRCRCNCAQHVPSAMSGTLR